MGAVGTKKEGDKAGLRSWACDSKWEGGRTGGRRVCHSACSWSIVCGFLVANGRRSVQGRGRGHGDDAPCLRIDVSGWVSGRGGGYAVLYARGLFFARFCRQRLA